MRKCIAAMIIGLALVASVAMAGVLGSDSSDDAYRRTTLKFFSENLSLAVADSNAVNSATVKLADGLFPEGHIVIHGAVAWDVEFDTSAISGGANAGDWGVGSVAGSGTDITTTEVDIIPKTAVTFASTTNDAVIADDAIIDGSATAADVSLNVIVDGATVLIQTNNIVASGNIAILWSLISDD